MSPSVYPCVRLSVLFFCCLSCSFSLFFLLIVFLDAFLDASLLESLSVRPCVRKSIPPFTLRKKKPKTEKKAIYILAAHWSYTIAQTDLFAHPGLFLDATTHLCKRLCPSVRWSVSPSVRRSVCPVLFSNAEYRCFWGWKDFKWPTTITITTTTMMTIMLNECRQTGRIWCTPAVLVR